MTHSQEFFDLVNDALTRVETCEIEDVKKIIDNGQGDTIIVDVRDLEEYKKGFIPGAIHLSKGVIEFKIIQTIPDKNREIILYCGGGHRSALAADNLKKMGYHSVKSMNKGFKGWVGANFNIAKENE